MAMLPPGSGPGHDEPPIADVLGGPAEYRKHVGDVMVAAHNAARRFQSRGDRYSMATIIIASSALGFVTAAVDAPQIGVITGVLGSAGGAIASWAQRGHFDRLASANRTLCNTLEREIREYDAGVGSYENVPEIGAAANAEHRYQLFAERCEQYAAEAQSIAEKDRPGL